MTEKKQRAVIVIAGFVRTVGVRGSRRPTDMFVYSVSWTGKGNEISRFCYGDDRMKAAQFGSAVAYEVGKQLVNRFRCQNVRVLAGERVEQITARPAREASADELKLAADLRKFEEDIKRLGPLGVLAETLRPDEG